MCYSKEDIIKDLHNLGIRSGDVVLMHSSYKSLGNINGGAKTFYEAFLELLGKEGTLVIPTLTYEYVTREQTVFNKQNTPSCVGYLSEFFRTQVSGTKRSFHATHSCCAFGKYADEIILNHEKDITPVGENSPFSKIPKYNGKILMLGCNTARNTSMHGVEETLFPHNFINEELPVTYTLIDNDRIEQVKSYRHNFFDKNGDKIIQRYDRIVDLLSENEVSVGYVLDAKSYLLDARAVWKTGYNKLKNDPFYFVDFQNWIHINLIFVVDKHFKIW